MTRRSGRVTVVDVAAVAGYSVATVSRALRGFGNVSADTVARVKAVAEELGYRPNRTAAQLRSGTTRSVAVIVPNLDSWYFGELLAGIEAVLAEEGYDMLLMAALGDADLQRLLMTVGPRGRVDGVIVSDLLIEATTIDAMRSMGIGIVTAGAEVETCPSVRVDDRAVGYTATSHLLDLGHTRIGLLRGLTRSPRTGSPRFRRDGYHDALRDAGIEPDRELEVAGRFSAAGGLAAASELSSRRVLPTAVFAMSDPMAVAAAEIFRRLGFDVPGDVSIVGVDGREVAEAFDITTISQPVAAVGATAARLLLDGFDQPDVVEHILLPTELVVRGSTGPVPGPDPRR